MKRYHTRLAALTLLLIVFIVCPHLGAAQTSPIRIIFMHHSTGAGLIWQGGVREAFTDLGYEFWDHGYNEEGLVDPSGTYLGDNWDVPGDNTDPDGWYGVFGQPVTEPADNTLSHMLEFDVIIFKSCFPSSNIDSDAMFQDYQRYFLSIRDVIDQHPDKLFIPFTTPPLVPNETAPENAARARQWAEYLTSPEYLDGHPNIAVFDFFSQLADEEGFLRADYRGDEWDSHPNERANQTVGPIFVDFVDTAIREFVPGAAVRPEPEAETAAPDTDTPTVSTGSGFEDFERADVLAEWWDYTNEPVTDFSCTLDNTGHNSEQALKLAFDIPGGGNAGCGFNFGPDPGWATAEGISLYWRADQPGMPLRIGFAVQDPANPAPENAAPFEIEVITQNDAWTQITIRWEDLARAEWYDGDVNTFDPAQVVWMAFDVGHWEMAQTGTIWIDDIQLVPAP